MKIKYQKLRDNAELPYAATEMSGGLDIVASYIELNEDKAIVYTGLSMQPEPGYMLRFSPRSSFTKYKWILQNSPALGDADYTGEYYFVFRAIPTSGLKRYGRPKIFTFEDFPYKVGDRFIQMWAEKIVTVEFEETQLEITERQGGFGSTGK